MVYVRAPFAAFCRETEASWSMEVEQFCVRRSVELGVAEQALLNEYYDEIDVFLRDDFSALEQALRTSSSGMWLAWRGQEAVGCVILRPLTCLPHAGECKRLYVRPHARKRGVAEALLSEMEQHGRSSGLEAIYLDSKDDLVSALSLYRKRGYALCERYNANPQATVFLRKRLGSNVNSE